MQPLQVITLTLTLALALATTGQGQAHDVWANNEPVPPWVKAQCCGPQDVHHLSPNEVHAEADGYHVNGYPDVIPFAVAQPSPDGEFWIFYKRFPNGDFSKVYCFFAPFNGT